MSRRLPLRGLIAILAVPLAGAAVSGAGPTILSRPDVDAPAPAPIRGRAAPGTTVRVVFDGNSYDTRTNARGEWSVTIPAMPAGAILVNPDGLPAAPFRTDAW